MAESKLGAVVRWLLGPGDELNPLLSPPKLPSAATTFGETITTDPQARKDKILRARYGEDGETAGFTRELQQSRAYRLWLTNPLGYRLVELVYDFVIGDGFDVKAEDKKVQGVIDAHLDDPENGWRDREFERAEKLGVYGSTAFRAFVTKENGHVRLAPIPAEWIRKFEPDSNHCERLLGFAVSPPGRDAEDLRVVRVDKEPGSPTHGLRVGNAFYFVVNRIPDTPHGVSDLFRVVDWISGYTVFLQNAIERVVLLNKTIYDVTVKGSNPDAVTKVRNELEQNPPKAGGFRVHDDNQSYQSLSPSLGAVDIEALARVLKLVILAGIGVPEHWLSEGSNANKATAALMGTPIFRKLRRRQSQWGAFKSEILEYVIDQAIIAGRLENTVNRKFQVLPPDVSAEDMRELAGALATLTDSLVAAVDANFVGHEAAAKLWAAQASELGVDVEALSAATSAGNTDPGAAAVAATAALAAAAARQARASEVEGADYIKMAAARSAAGAGNGTAEKAAAVEASA